MCVVWGGLVFVVYVWCVCGVGGGGDWLVRCMCGVCEACVVCVCLWCVCLCCVCVCVCVCRKGGYINVTIRTRLGVMKLLGEGRGGGGVCEK